MSNYPPGMTRAHYDHVESITRCEECGTDISYEWEDGLCENDIPRCPGGCAERDWDVVRDEQEGF